MIDKIIKQLQRLRKDVNNSFNPEHIAYNGALTDAVKAVRSLYDREIRREAKRWDDLLESLT